MTEKVFVLDVEKEKSIENFLARAVLKDAAKGGSPWRTTAEVAEACDMTHAAAEDLLSTLAEFGQVEFENFLDEDIWRSPLTLEEAQGAFPNYLP